MTQPDWQMNDGLSYYTPMVTFYHRLNYTDYNTSLPLVHQDGCCEHSQPTRYAGYFSHPAYEYVKFVLERMTTEKPLNYDLTCELRLMTDIPMESWIMNRECTSFEFYPEEYDLDTNTAFYCSVTVTFHNVVGTKALLSNLFLRTIKDLSMDPETIDRYNDYTRDIFGKSNSRKMLDRLRLTINVRPTAPSLKGFISYVPWTMPDEMDRIFADLYGDSPIVKLVGYINRNLHRFMRYEVTINELPPIEGLTTKQVELIMNKILPHKRTRRIVDDSRKRINLQRYLYEPSLSPNLYAMFINKSSVADINKYLSSLKGLKRYLLASDE